MVLARLVGRPRRDRRRDAAAWLRRVADPRSEQMAGAVPSAQSPCDSGLLYPARHMTRPNPARHTADDNSLSIYPHQVHIGDRFTDADTDGAAEWEVVSRPVTFKKGHEVRARVQRPGIPATARGKYWAAQGQIPARPLTAPLHHSTRIDRAGR